MDSRFSVLLCFAAVLSTAISNPDDDKCSSEDRASEKVVRLEIQVQQLSRDVRRLEETMLSVLDHRQEEMDKFTHKLQQDMGNVTNFVSKVSTPCIAFSAYKPVDHTPVRGQIIVFSSALLNEGAAYSTTSGKFTAPVKGLYLFTAHLCNKHAMYMIFSIFLDEAELAVTTSADTSVSLCSSVSALSMVEVGQQITVRGAYDSSELYENEYHRGSFIGVLMHT